jgi:hypothetical protein
MGLSEGNSPPHEKGCALKKIPRSLRDSRADGVVAYEQLYL